MIKDFNYYIVNENSLSDMSVDEVTDFVNVRFNEFTTEPTSDDDKICMYIRLCDESLKIRNKINGLLNDKSDELMKYMIVNKYYDMMIESVLIEPVDDNDENILKEFE